MENSQSDDPREGAAETSLGLKRCYSYPKMKRICQDDYNDQLEMEMKMKMENFGNCTMVMAIRLHYEYITKSTLKVNWIQVEFYHPFKLLN